MIHIEGFNRFRIIVEARIAWATYVKASGLTGFVGTFSFQNRSVNFLHVVLNQPGIFTKKERTLCHRQVSHSQQVGSIMITL